MLISVYKSSSIRSDRTCCGDEVAVQAFSGRQWPASSILLGAMLLAQSAPARAQQTYSFDIPRGDLASVVAGLSRATGRPITLPATLAVERTAGPIQGSSSLEEALTRALAGTGLQAVGSSRGSFSIRDPVATTGATTGATAPGADLAAIDVNDTGGGPYNDQGFQAGDAGQTIRLGNAPLREVPLTVNVVTQKVLESQLVTDSADAVRNVPGVSLDLAGSLAGRKMYTIRGFAQDDYNTTTDGQFNQGLSSVPIDDIERIEVLKGPTSILTGESGLGGVVNVVTKQPTPERIRTLIVRYGDYNYKTLAADLGGVVEGTEGLTFRFVGSGNHADQSYGGYHNPRAFVVAPSLGWQGQDLTVAAGVRYINQHLVQPQWTLIPNRGDGMLSDIIRIPRRGVPFGNTSFGTDVDALTWWTTQSYDLGHVLGMDVTINNSTRVLSDVSSNVFPVYYGRAISSIGPVQPFGRREQKYYYNNVTERSDVTAKYESDDIVNRLKVGYDHIFPYQTRLLSSSKSNKEDPYLIDLLSGYTTSGLRMPSSKFPFRIVWKDHEAIDSYYVVDKLDLLDNRLHLFGNVKFDDYRIEHNLVRAPNYKESFQGTSATLSWAAGSAFDVAPWLTVYGNRSTGFTPSSQFNAVTRTGYPPERVDLAEVGARYYLSDRKLTVTTSLFDLVRSNVVSQNIDDPTKTRFVKGMRNTGLELEAQGEVFPGMSLVGAYTIINPKVSDKDSGLGLIDIPKHQASLWLTYRFQSPGLSGWTVGSGVQFIGRSLTCADDPSVSYRVGGYTTFDTLIGYERDDFALSLKVNNIFNRYGYLQSPDISRIVLLRGRNAMLQMTYKF